MRSKKKLQMDTKEQLPYSNVISVRTVQFKTECIKGNNCETPMEERQKVLYVSKVMKQKRLETLERITSDYGTQLRMN